MDTDTAQEVEKAAETRDMIAATSDQATTVASCKSKNALNEIKKSDHKYSNKNVTSN